MAEKIDLTVPFKPDPREASELRLARVDLNWEASSIVLELADPVSGVRQSFVYDGQEAMTIMQALNKANLSTKSLHRRIMEKLLADGHLEGTISGAPD
jgi:hypothetical protein